MARKHSNENSATNMDHSSPEPPDSTRNGRLHLLHENLLIMDGLITVAAPHIAEGGNHGGDNRYTASFLVTLGGGGLGVHPEAIVDDVLAVLPSPARHHILPDFSEEDFHFTI